MTTLKLKLFRMKTPMVRVLQEMLAKLMFNPGPVDGIFGPKTKAAVVEFQKKCRLTVDGVAGPQTFEKLYTMTGMLPNTEHFDFKKEFDRPHHSEQKYLDAWTPCPVKYYANAHELFFHLETLRAELNRLYADGGEVKIYTRSGYRGTAYNRICGGATNSQHLYGTAVDLYAVRVKNGVKEERIPNCYQVGVIANKLLSFCGRGFGSNTNVHIDIGPTRSWWYTYTSWSKWKAGQGKAA